MVLLVTEPASQCAGKNVDGVVVGRRLAWQRFRQSIEQFTQVLPVAGSQYGGDRFGGVRHGVLSGLLGVSAPLGSAAKRSLGENASLAVTRVVSVLLVPKQALSLVTIGFGSHGFRLYPTGPNQTTGGMSIIWASPCPSGYMVSTDATPMS